MSDNDPFEAKTCANCANLDQHKKGGYVLDTACRGDQGRKWPLNVAQKESRCGKARIWWVAKEAK